MTLPAARSAALAEYREVLGHSLLLLQRIYRGWPAEWRSPRAVLKHAAQVYRGMPTHSVLVALAARKEAGLAIAGSTPKLLT